MKRVRLGFLTPSSNTVLEPMTVSMIADLPEVSAHFARFAVTEIALSARALAQFDPAPILAAAALLGHAKVDAIAWNGTSASWLGFGRDENLCAAITAATGIAAGTSVLALREAMGLLGARRLGLVTPYTADVEAAIVAQYAQAGWTCVATARADLTDNFAFAEVPEADITRMVRDVARARPDAIAIVCTNMRVGGLVAVLEAELGIPVLDSVATAVWTSLRIAGVDPRRVSGFGRLFSL